MKRIFAVLILNIIIGCGADSSDDVVNIPSKITRTDRDIISKKTIEDEIIIGKKVNRPAELVYNMDFKAIGPRETLNTICKYEHLGKTPVYNIYLCLLYGHTYTLCISKEPLEGLKIIDKKGLVDFAGAEVHKFSFIAPGMEITGYKPKSVAVGKEVSVTISKRDKYTLIYLDQLFSGGGSGGATEFIIRKYVIIRDDKIHTTPGHIILTEIFVAYPRYYDGEWSKGRLEYAHAYESAEEPQEDRLTVNSHIQYFNERVFENQEEELKHAPDGKWGELFRYDKFNLPVKPEIHYRDEEVVLRLVESKL